MPAHYAKNRFLHGAILFLRILLSYRLHGMRTLFSSATDSRARLKRLHRRNALLLRERMLAMRGVLIKIGQFLSSRVDILPEEYTDELSKLQDQVPPAPFQEIARRVTDELGPLDQVFSSFDEQPIASASLGQVHRACLLDGDCIVVKVQYPNIEHIIEADIRTLRFVIGVLRILYRHINLEVIYSEFSRIVREELDYLQEAGNAETFRRNFAKNPRVRVPIVYWPYTTSKVLTLEYIDGIKITDFDEIDRQGIDRRHVARLLAEAYAQMFFHDGLFHGDPHPGNIFVRPGPELILVDFGMVDRISSARRTGLRKAFGAIIDRDATALVRAFVDMGFIPLARDIQPLVQFVDRILAKYRDMSSAEFKSMNIEQIGSDIQEALQLAPSVQIPNDFILFGRVVGMLNGLGSRLDPGTNLIEIAAPYAKNFIRKEEFSAETLLRTAQSSGLALTRLPKHLEEFLVRASRGEASVEITSRSIVEQLDRIGRIGKAFLFLVLAIATAMLILLLRIYHLEQAVWWASGLAAALALLLARYLA